MVSIAISNQNTTMASKPGPKHVDVFQLDDLLVACAQDIIVNGFDTLTIPDSIKEWVAGKVLKSLPRRLTQKLLSFVLDNRDVSDSIGLRENATGDEFTMIVYKSQKQKERVESLKYQEELKKAKLGHLMKNPDGTDKTDTDKANDNENDNQPKDIFNNMTMTDDGNLFATHELIMDQSQTIPMLGGRYGGGGGNRNRKRTAATTEDELDDLTMDTADDSQDEEGTKHKKKKRKRSSGKSRSQPANCPVCDKEYSSRSKMNQHCKAMHPSYWAENKPMTQAQKRLREMEEIVTDPDSGLYSCLLCSKQFASAAHIVRHVDCVHRGDQHKKPKPCPICGKIISSHMADHLTTHMDVRPHGCDICGKTYKTKRCLRKHKETHSDLTYPCHLCGHQAKTKSNLKVHIRDMHNGTKEHDCPICNQSFIRLDNLRQHCRNVHKDVNPINWQVELEQRKREKEEKRKEQDALRRASQGGGSKKKGGGKKTNTANDKDKGDYPAMANGQQNPLDPSNVNALASAYASGFGNNFV